MFGYDTLMNHYRTNFSLMTHYKYNLSEIENILPWEKFLYMDMLRQFVQQQDDLAKNQAAVHRTQGR